jgi:hypothetical protein
MATKSKEQRIHAALLKHIEVPRIDDPEFLTRDLRGLINKMMVPELVEDDGIISLFGHRFPKFHTVNSASFNSQTLDLSQHLRVWDNSTRSCLVFDPNNGVIGTWRIHSDGSVFVMPSVGRARWYNYKPDKNATLETNGSTLYTKNIVPVPAIPRLNEFGELSGPPWPSEKELAEFFAKFIAQFD